MQLSRHSYNHVIEIRIKIFSFRHISSKGCLKMISSRNIIDITNTTWSKSNLREICRPNPSISILSLILREIRSIYSIRNNSIPFIPFLIIILFEMVVCRVDCEVLRNNRGQFQLFVGLIKQYVILFIHHAVTIRTISHKYHKSSSNWTTIKCS